MPPSTLSETLAGFFTLDFDRVRAALEAMESTTCSWGAVTSLDTVFRHRGRLCFHRNGLFAEHLFGPTRDHLCACEQLSGVENDGEICSRCGVVCGPASLRGERWGHVDVVGIVHPVVLRLAVVDLGMVAEHLPRVVRGELALRDEEPILPQLEKDGDLSGPPAVIALLEAVNPEHSLLPLCRITKIPVPPADARPMLSDLAPTMVDPWIGPVNEAWLAFVTHAQRERRLIELEAPPIILRSEAMATQGAFLDLFEVSEPPAPLVPPLARAPELDEDDEQEMLDIAFVRSDLLVIQRARGVYVVRDDGTVVHRAPPAGCQLAGVLDDRIAVFSGFFAELDPMLADDASVWGTFVEDDDESDMRNVAPHAGELSALDCETGEYLVDVPNGVPPASIGNDEPEDLFFTDPRSGKTRKLFVGADRPAALATTRDMRFVLVGEGGATTQVIDQTTGIPQVNPAEPRPSRDMDHVAVCSPSARDDQADDELDDDELDDDEGYGVAIAFGDQRWHLLWPGGIYADHDGQRPLLITPAVHAGAFDPTVERLAVIAGDQVGIIDLRQRELLRVFPLPNGR